MPEAPHIKKLRINYEKSKDYRVFFADDALVGQTMTKGITMDFYTGNFIPRTELHTWSEEKKQFDITYEDDDFTPYQRTLQLQIVMTVESAEGLIKAMSDRLKLLKGESRSDKT